MTSLQTLQSHLGVMPISQPVADIILLLCLFLHFPCEHHGIATKKSVMFALQHLVHVALKAGTCCNCNILAHLPTHSEFIMPFLLAFLYLMPAFILSLCHLFYIFTYTLHQCREGATSRITRWYVLLPCNSQIKLQSV
jgi:hypothetical protein